MGSQSSRPFNSGTSNQTSSNKHVSGIGGRFSIENIASDFELTGSNQRVEINTNKGFLKVSGMNNEVMINENHGKVFVNGFNNRITIQQEFGDGRIQQEGAGNSVTTLKRISRPLNPPPVVGQMHLFGNAQVILPPQPQIPNIPYMSNGQADRHRSILNQLNPPIPFNPTGSRPSNHMLPPPPSQRPPETNQMRTRPRSAQRQNQMPPQLVL